MATEPQPEMPMGDASMLPQQQGPLDGSMGGGNEMPPMDEPDMGGEDPMMGGDPSMGGEGGNPDKKRQDIQKNIGKACADFRTYQGQDKEDLGKWISGMLDSLDGESGDGDTSIDGDSIDSPMEEPQEMPMESIVFTKRQFEMLNENLGVGDVDDEKKVKPEKKLKNKAKNSPFNNPNFQK